MRKIILIAIALLVYNLAEGQDNFVKNQVIVQLNKEAKIESVINDFNASHLISIYLNHTLSKRGFIHLLEFDSSTSDVPTILSLLKMDERILISQPNHTDIQQRIIPNDLEYPIQWSLNSASNSRIFAPEAWDITTDGITANGDTIVMAVVDGGVYIQHIDLNLFKNKHEIPNNGIDDDNNGYIDDYDGWNAYSQSGVITSDDHGTHCAGIIGAKTNNSNGIAGIVWNGSVLPINASSGIESVVIEGYGYALEMRSKYNESDGDSGAFVVATNSSFGVDFAQPSNYPIWCAFYNLLGEVGVLNAAATANNGVDIDIVGDVPTGCPSNYMIAVSNINSTGSILGGYGEETIDLAAPGTNIRSTISNHSYSFKTGTSMATPHVTGVIGAMYSALCSYDINTVYQSPDSMALWVKDKLLSSVTVDSNLADKNNTSGKLNMLQAIQLVQGNHCMEFQSQVDPDTCGTCDGMITLHVSGDYPPYTILFSDSSNSIGDSIFYNLCSDSFTLAIIDSSGYTYYDTLEITGNDSLIMTHTYSPASDSNASDGSISVFVTGGTFPYSYLWNNGDTSSTNNSIPHGYHSVLVNDSNGCSISDSFYVFTVGIQNIEDSKFKIVPNPNNGNFQISGSTNENINSVTIYDSAGRLVFEKEYSVIHKHIDISTVLNIGVYFIRVNEKSPQTLIIQK